ncbi:MAG: hypothetical protein SAK29_07290 [Scytonema sp. PMC 1069.18]|nr:hypothetical protein [Scytonema sp. PMC 1069.18]MEC4885649.1 hypothetical protein [Scytonema sp. PMC 1070.18]
MTKPNFKTMSKAELRQYVLAHRDDEEAFYELSDRIAANAKPLESDEQLMEIIQQHQQKQ